MPVTINGTTGIVTPSENTSALTVGSITGILKATSGVVSQAVAGTDYLTSTSGGTITIATAQTASGTSVDFTGIPSWAKRVTVIFAGVSTNGTSNLQIQIGAGSVTSSGYNSSAWTAITAVSGNVTTGFILTAQNAAATTYHGSINLTTLGSNNWANSHSIGGQPNNYQSVGGGSIALGNTLDRVRITTVNGTDTFDAGTINISYE